METQFKERAVEYLGEFETLIEELGSGQEGFVYRTSRKTALKVVLMANLHVPQDSEGCKIKPINGIAGGTIIGKPDERVAH